MVCCVTCVGVIHVYFFNQLQDGPAIRPVQSDGGLSDNFIGHIMSGRQRVQRRTLRRKLNQCYQGVDLSQRDAIFAGQLASQMRGPPTSRKTSQTEVRGSRAQEFLHLQNIHTFCSESLCPESCFHATDIHCAPWL